jgi:hypothetical protein
MPAVRRPFLLMMLLLAALTLPGLARAEVRGGSFEVAGTVGVGAFDPAVGADPCAWYGAYVGHRFRPLAERFHLGFQAGWEGCVTKQKVTGDRVDFILVDFGFTWGVKATKWLIPYGMTGGGFLVADTTPSGGQPYPRTAFQGGGGVAAVLAKYLLLDLKVRVIAFENIQFGGFGGTTGTTANVVTTFSLGGHI